MIPPDHPDAPKYWVHETSGVLPRVVKKYLGGSSLCPMDVMYMRAYFRQWAFSLVWDRNPHRTPESERELADLRRRIDDIKDARSIYQWLKLATAMGMDPL